MQRREFLKNSSLSVIAVCAYGSIHFDGKRYVGDCETTSDILGPFYRPGSPVRNNLAIYADEHDDLVKLSGFVRHDDCTTPLTHAKIELWHCNSKGEYDNHSPEYRYRGTAYSNETGHYSFLTHLPVPYHDSPIHLRPAHYHLMITAENYLPFMTQLYFSGDPYIKDDIYSSAPAAEKRILAVGKSTEGNKKVSFDINMSLTKPNHAPMIDQLVGSYTDTENS